MLMHETQRHNLYENRFLWKRIQVFVPVKKRMYRMELLSLSAQNKKKKEIEKHDKMLSFHVAKTYEPRVYDRESFFI